MMEKEYSDMIEAASNIVFITGAGISTESGIPDFRSSGGHFKDRYKGLKPQFLLSTEGWRKYPGIAYDFLESLRENEATPGIAHQFIKGIQDQGKLSAVITQNLDDLHEKSGINEDKLIKLHGTLGYKCSKCGNDVSISKDYLTRSGNFKVDCCNSAIARPKAVLYGDLYDRTKSKRANDLIADADLIIAMGTGLDIPFLYSLFTANTAKKLFINRDPLADVDPDYLPMLLGEFKDILI